MQTRLVAFFSCGFRPFFLFSGIYGFLLIGFWLFFWRDLITLPTSLGGPIVWHVYELIFGFTLAAIVGFLTTAVPEFTGKKEIQHRPLMALFSLWLLGRVAFWGTGIWGIFPPAVLNLGFLLAFMSYLIPTIWNDPGRKHISFISSVGLLLLLQCGFYISAYNQHSLLPWLLAAIGTVMCLIIVALSRISMRVINGTEEGIEILDKDVEYLARPPRRNMAIFCIGTYSFFEFFIPLNSITSWLALAASAAMLNLLNDWHIGKALFNRWVFAMYSVYCLMALGYALLGFAILLDWPIISAARHVLTIGALSLSILLIQLFSGQAHCGESVLFKGWMGMAILLIMTAMGLRFAMSTQLFLAWYSELFLLSAGAWMLAFALFVWHFFKPLTSPSSDQRTGCL